MKLYIMFYLEPSTVIIHVYFVERFIASGKDLINMFHIILLTFRKLRPHRNFQYFERLLLTGCPNSDGAINFYWSHDGYWNTENTYVGDHYDTVLSCANKCNDDNTCIAFSYHPTRCWNYYDKQKIVSSNEESWSGAKAYVKCTGD